MILKKHTCCFYVFYFCTIAWLPIISQGLLLITRTQHVPTRTRCYSANDDAWSLLAQECLLYEDNSNNLSLERMKAILQQVEVPSLSNQWWQWMKATPCPLVMNWTYTERCVCRVIVLPSGMPLTSPLYEPTGTVVLVKLLSGKLQKQPLSFTTHTMPGGTDRMYQAMDTGPAVLLEVLLLPAESHQVPWIGENLFVHSVDWPAAERLQLQQQYTKEEEFSQQVDSSHTNKASTLHTEFQSSLGGLQPQIDTIVRRVLDGRVLLRSNSTTNTVEAQALACLGLVPVRGLLLYGPPGCGKTALARELARVLRARDPKIVAAPELLDRWVGGSEKQVRALFQDAEAELAACQGDASKSALHVIVMDEIDAVFRKRTSSEDSGESTRSSVVNQILSKLDGVQAIPNVLVIGMTNRKELLDEALLRPGRLEVQIEIPMPDRKGRREILAIHFAALRNNGRLCPRLCCALDGPSDERQRVTKFWDLAADRVTGGFSGADLAGLVRCAGSMALARARKDGSGVDGLFITLEDVQQALVEIRQSRV